MTVLFLSDIAGSPPATYFTYLISTPLSRGEMPHSMRRTFPREWGIPSLLVLKITLPMPCKEDNGIEDTDATTNSTEKSEKSDEQRASPRPLLGSDGKPVASTIPMFNEMFDEYKNRGYNTKKSDIIRENMKLLLDPDSIIRVNVRIAKAAPHIHERCTKADGKSITEALKIEYTHKSNPSEPLKYKRPDINCDIEKQWIYLESPSSGGLVDIEAADKNEMPIDVAPEVASPPRTPLSAATTPLRATDYNLRSSAARQSPSMSSSGVNTHRYNLRRPAMPAIYSEMMAVSLPCWREAL